LKVNIVRKRESVKDGFIKKSIKTYIKSSTPRELSFDWITPFLLAALSFVFVFFIMESTNILGILKVIEKINDTAVNVIAILAGFNTASLAVITSANRELLNSLNQKSNPTSEVPFSTAPLWKRVKIAIFNNTKKNTLEITVNFFCYAVIIQLITLILGLLSSVIYDFLPNITNFNFISISDFIKRVLLTVYGITWLSLILHSIFISLRNVEMVYAFIMYKDKN
jgi:hypothetical protein